MSELFCKFPETVNHTCTFGTVLYAKGISGKVYVADSGASTKVKIKGLKDDKIWSLILHGYSVKEIIELRKMTRYQLIGEIIDLHAELETYQDV